MKSVGLLYVSLTGQTDHEERVAFSSFSYSATRRKKRRELFPALGRGVRLVRRTNENGCVSEIGKYSVWCEKGLSRSSPRAESLSHFGKRPMLILETWWYYHEGRGRGGNGFLPAFVSGVVLQRRCERGTALTALVDGKKVLSRGREWGILECTVLAQKGSNGKTKEGEIVAFESPKRKKESG